MKAAELFVRCMEREETPFLFGIPGEENLDLMDALHDSKLRFVTTRHEQGTKRVRRLWRTFRAGSRVGLRSAWRRWDLAQPTW
jgi:hypothetical protein